MTTLAIMKARIADELIRSDIDALIATAITDAIGIYESERFYFSESRSICVFNTVAGQQDYGPVAEADLGNLLVIDYISVTVGGVTSQLAERIQPDVMEAQAISATLQDEPCEYAWYDSLLRLWPIPSGAYQIRVAGMFKVAAPGSDTEIGNHWMVDAERLIRSRAKYQLALHVLRDVDLAQAMTAEARDALDTLKGRTNRLTGTGVLTSTDF